MARVLIVDDEGSLRRLTRMVLEQEGHQVVEAEDGRFAISAVSDDGPFDVILLDLVMPWVDGFEVLRNLAWIQTKVIVLTARDDPYAQKRAVRTHEIFRYLTKPVDQEDLLDVIREAIATA